MPFHWDDRAKLYEDYKYLLSIYERLLEELADKLNNIHGVDHDLRYWRILIGPWLGYFTQAIFDRWTAIKQAVEEYELSETVVLTGSEELLVPRNMEHFTRLYIEDEWNHHIYASILKSFSSVKCVEKKREDNARIPKPKLGKSRKRMMQRNLVNLYSRCMGLFAREADYFLRVTYLPLMDELKLNRRLGNIPQLWRTNQPPDGSVDETQRKWIINEYSDSGYEACVRSLIPKQIPTVYLEGYSDLVKKANSMPWPKQPKLIWTSNAYNADEIFKIWTATRVEQGSLFVIGQHGGHYGIGRWSFTEVHEKAICDRFLSWGWTDPDDNKVVPVGRLTTRRPLGIKHSKQSRALLVTGVCPRQSYWMYSFMVGRQWLDYFNEQCLFVENLPSQIRAALTVRLHRNDYGWDQISRWHERFSDVCLDEGISNIDDLIQQSRVYISTYNATTFLESFTMDVPTIIYWNPSQWELRDSAIPYFDELKRVGVFHENPQSAARHLATVWDDIDLWWKDPAVQEVLERFKARYSFLPDDLPERLEKTLREIVAGSESRTRHFEVQRQCVDQ